VYGPDFRATVQTGSGNGRVILSRWPILSILSVQVAPSNAFPRQWTTVPSGHYDVQVPPVSVYGTVAPSAAIDGGQAILIEPGWLNWCNGRNGWLVKVQYINGWPHTSLTAAASTGDTSLTVDDCTGWAITSEWGQTGAAGVIYDGNYQETAQVTAASATSGPGSLTLSSALAWPHDAGSILTTMPPSVMEAVILFSAAQALARGATSTTVHAIPGGSGGGGGSAAMSEYIAMGELLLSPLKRTI
jgi:hypothetical protein